MLGFDKTFELPQQGNKFIQVSIEFAGFKGLKNSEITKVADDISNILYNTQSVFYKNGEWIGCINPYLGITVININGNIEECGMRPISKPFKPFLTKEKDGETKITFYPMRDKKRMDLYSLPRFHQDGYSIYNACKWINEKYSIQGGEFGLKQDTADLINGEPAIEKIEGILHMKYLVSERIENAKIMPELDKLVFTDDVNETISKLIRSNKKEKLNKYQKEWITKVEKIQNSIN